MSSMHGSCDSSFEAGSTFFENVRWGRCSFTSAASTFVDFRFETCARIAMDAVEVGGG